VEFGTVVGEPPDGTVIDESDGIVGTTTSAKAIPLPKNKGQPRLLNNKTRSDCNNTNITSMENR
jgi:hypothetical protein